MFQESPISFLKQIFSINPELQVYFMPDFNEVPDIADMKYHQIYDTSTFYSEIMGFDDGIYFKQAIKKELLKAWRFINPCIYGYLIKQSYQKLNKNRIFENPTNQQIEIINSNDYVVLRYIGSGSSFEVYLIYYIKTKELLAIKKLIEPNQQELFQRAYNNSSKISFPFIPKFYGKVKDENILVTEYIHGNSLSNIKQLHLTKFEKITIMVELITTIQYLQNEKFIFRDLQPENIIIDQNKNAIIIDFDRMIDFDYDLPRTNDLISCYIAPEVPNGKFSIEADIY